MLRILDGRRLRSWKLLAGSCLILLSACSSASDKLNLIRVTSPRPGDLLSGTVSITGEARGTWYFEASFPVRLVDTSDTELAATHAEAQGDWMTEDFVPFTATLTVPATSATTGTLILEKDNPSGLPEKADELRVPVRFK